MKKILLRLESRLDEMATTLNQLKAENAVLKREILGIEVSAYSNSMSSLENKTLREIVEETKLEVKAISTKILAMENYKGKAEKPEANGLAKPSAVDESVYTSFVEPNQEYPVVEIQRKTVAEEEFWMKQKYNEMKKEKAIKNSETIWQRTAQALSSSIRFPKNARGKYRMVISNFLDTPLTDPQYYFLRGSRNNGPAEISANTTEIMSFLGQDYCCEFLCTLEISKVLRVTINCYYDSWDDIYFGIAFTPACITTDMTLYTTFFKMPPVPDVSMNVPPIDQVPRVLFVNHGNLIVRGHLPHGSKPIVHVEIFQAIGSLHFQPAIKNRMVDGKTMEFFPTEKSETNSTLAEIHEKFSCNIEIVNCLSVTMKNWTDHYSNCEIKYFMPFEILPFQREKFFGSDETKVEVMFSYEIQSTDIELVVALKVGPNFNSFAAAFVQFQAVTDANELEALMDPDMWKTHLHRKYAMAREGVQLIQIRNIRAEIVMTEEEQSCLKIRVFAV